MDNFKLITKLSEIGMDILKLEKAPNELLFKFNNLITEVNDLVEEELKKEGKLK